jgi:hypothetical protein
LFVTSGSRSSSPHARSTESPPRRFARDHLVDRADPLPEAVVFNLYETVGDVSTR